MELFNHVRGHDTLADVFLYNLVDLAELILLEILNQQIFFMSNSFLPTHMNSCEQRSILLSWMNVEGFLEYKFSWKEMRSSKLFQILSSGKMTQIKPENSSAFWESLSLK